MRPLKRRRALLSHRAAAVEAEPVAHAAAGRAQRVHGLATRFDGLDARALIAHQLGNALGDLREGVAIGPLGGVQLLLRLLEEREHTGAVRTLGQIIETEGELGHQPPTARELELAQRQVHKVADPVEIERLHVIRRLARLEPALRSLDVRGHILLAHAGAAPHVGLGSDGEFRGGGACQRESERVPSAEREPPVQLAEERQKRLRGARERLPQSGHDGGRRVGRVGLGGTRHRLEPAVRERALDGGGQQVEKVAQLRARVQQHRRALGALRDHGAACKLLEHMRALGRRRRRR